MYHVTCCYEWEANSLVRFFEKLGIKAYSSPNSETVGGTVTVTYDDSVFCTKEQLSDEGKRSIEAGLKDMREGRVKPFKPEIRTERSPSEEVVCH